VSADFGSCRFIAVVPVSAANADPRQQAIGTLLARHAGKAPDAKAVAAAAAGIWSRVSAQLAPVIGARGVDVLIRRSVHLTSTAFPWLQLAEDHENDVPVLESLTTQLASQDASTAADVSRALLMTFTELLATLIGETLTERLLGPVWAPPPMAPQQETGK